MILWKLVQPIFRFRNLDETFPDLFYLLYGILMSYRTRNKSLSVIQVFSLDKASKSIEWILKENILENDCVHYKGILSFINIFQFLLNIGHIRIFDLKKNGSFYIWRRHSLPLIQHRTFYSPQPVRWEPCLGLSWKSDFPQTALAFFFYHIQILTT